jgi:ADP-heptose:LPS heptosyltransferase
MIRPPLDMPHRFDYPELRLPSLLLSRYLYFLTRRPISRSNSHYLQGRIRGLMSLAQPFSSVQESTMQGGVRLLRTLNPQNVLQVADRLQLILFPFIQTQLPKEYIVADGSPPPNFLQEACNILLFLGPGIGIGDEIITFPLPTWFKANMPKAKVTVMSTYGKLWHRVKRVDQLKSYDQDLAILQVLRGELEPFDLVMFVDFEDPGLYRVICQERLLSKYVEMSLGAQVLTAVDLSRRWIYRLRPPGACYNNFYFGMNHLMRGLGLTPSIRGCFTDVVQHKQKSDEEELRIFVSPFTSKYDPSLLYWSRLVASLISPSTIRRVRIVLDPGPNSSTRQFARDTCRSASARAPSQVAIEIAHMSGTEKFSLEGVFDELEKAHIVVCVDSFAAHAAPTMGCTTLVVANPGVENWRVPNETSFYFNAEDPLPQVIAGMQQVLTHFGLMRRQDSYRPALSALEIQLASLVQHIQQLAEANGSISLNAWSEIYTELAHSHQALLERLPHWSSEARSLLCDNNYDNPIRGFAVEDTPPEALHQDMLHYQRNACLEWCNSNLYRYLTMLSAEIEHGVASI